MIDWASVRAEYEAGSSLRVLAARYGVSKSAIGKRKYNERWTEPQRRGQVDRPQAPQKYQPRDVNVAERVTLALSLRRQRLSYDEIAKRCGYADRSGAYKAIQRELQRRVVLEVDTLRAEEVEILDEIHQKVYPLVVEAAEPSLWAVDRLLELSKARRQMLNLDIKPDAELAQQNYTKRIILTHTLGGQDGTSDS